MKKIELTQGKVALVDDEDFEWLNQWKWASSNGKYVVRMPSRKIGKRKLILMHRVIMNAPDGMEVDHINNNGFDNRRCNLRLCSSRQNKANISLKKSNTSGYKGVYWNKPRKCWVAQIRAKGKMIYLGGFKDILDAAKAYQDRAKKEYGEFVKF